MGYFLAFVMDTLRKKEEPREQEIDHNVCVCCGSLNVTDHESKSDTEESDGEHENAVHR